MPDDIISKVEDFSKKHCQKDAEDAKLWENHVQLVRKYALKLAETENADKQVVEIAALLHDIGKVKGREKHHEHGYELSREFLKDIDIPAEKKELILKCVLKHRSEFSNEDNEIEVKIIQSADALAVLFDDEWQEYCRQKLPKEKLIAKYDKNFRKINLESARDLARPKIKELKEILEKNI